MFERVLEVIEPALEKVILSFKNDCYTPLNATNRYDKKFFLNFQHMFGEIYRRIEESGEIGRETEIESLMVDGEVYGAFSFLGDETVVEVYLITYDSESKEFESSLKLEYWDKYRGMENVVRQSDDQNIYDLDEMKNTILFMGRSGGLINLEDVRQELEEEIDGLQF